MSSHTLQQFLQYATEQNHVHLYIYFPLARFYFQYTTGSQSSRQTKVLSVTAPLLVRSHYNRITYYALDTQLLSYGPTGISYVGSFADFINEQSNLHLFLTCAPNTYIHLASIHYNLNHLTYIQTK